MSVWLSTTMIQALRNLIDLYTFYFETLERFLDGLLDLLCVCICQGLSSYAVTYYESSRIGRERYPRSHWHELPAAVTREQCQETQPCSLGACCYDFRQAL